MAGYVIKPGDTLSGLARRNGTSVKALMQANPQIADPNLIHAGASMTVPDGPATPADPKVSDAVAKGKAADQDCAKEDTGGAVKGCPLKKKIAKAEQEALAEPSDDDLLGEPPSDPMDETEFGKSFQQRVGAKLSETIAQYEADTGKTLKPETVETLFTDHVKAKELLMNDKSLHTTYRDILNQNVPATLQDARNAGYTEPTFMGSKYLGRYYHDPGNNYKFVSPNGHIEGIYNQKSGKLDKSKAYKGTFNFFGPDNFDGHKAADVDPYKKWGN